MHDPIATRGRARSGALQRALSAALALGSVLAFVSPRPPPTGGLDTAPDPIDRLEVRAAVLSEGAGRVEAFFRDRVEPVERVLRASGADAALVRSLALVLVREGSAAGIDPRVLASVLLVENPWLDPSAVSPQGATGLMQVMPNHAGRWGCASNDLSDVVANVCHGARILAAYLAQKDGDLDRALLAYNGCVKGENTPDCHLYPAHVYSRAGRAAMRRWLELR